MANMIIAVWGSPGSGTTLTSIKIAKELARNKQNVVLVLSDKETPTIPLLLPSLQNAKSLGDLMSIPKISPIDIFQHCISVEKNMSLLGYLLGENEMTWPEYEKEQVFLLLDLLRSIANYTVIDCSHHLLANVLTGVALQYSDIVMKVVNADPKSLSYMKSQHPFLRDQKFQYDEQLCIINNVYAFQDSKGYEDAFGSRVSYTLPHIPSLQMQFSEAHLLEPLSGREGRLYEPRIRAIVNKEIINKQQLFVQTDLTARKEEFDRAEPC
ncbi:hypothetical protein A7X67_01535 [Clostridium sp. W14A]|nr:hypothetical protein A7X67_01535 [Clostridium sp. W14A]